MINACVKSFPKTLNFFSKCHPFLRALVTACLPPKTVRDVSQSRRCTYAFSQAPPENSLDPTLNALTTSGTSYEAKKFKHNSQNFSLCHDRSLYQQSISESASLKYKTENAKARRTCFSIRLLILNSSFNPKLYF